MYFAVVNDQTFGEIMASKKASSAKPWQGARRKPLFNDYEPITGSFDELFLSKGTPRKDCRRLVELIDAMPAAHFRGEMSMYQRPGHIPGAASIPASSLLDDTGHYRSHDELAALHGSDHDTRVITYCGGGISASSNAFVMTRLGFTDVAVYTASLQEWAADPNNPLVTDTP